MFEAKKLVFYYAVSPVHMGAGSAIGAIDSPIQREVHTKHPLFAGSGLKGALRHHLSAIWPKADGKKNPLINRVFGPEASASDFAGAVSLSDAQLVALPVRALRGGYAYAVSPLTLARLQRLAAVAGLKPSWKLPKVDSGNALLCAGSAILDGGKIYLEAFEFTAAQSDDLTAIATWIASALRPAIGDFFADKLKTDLVLLNDTDFAHFANNAMVVEPHVRIDDDSGTADGGGLFFVENLPPESLLVGLVQASDERGKGQDKPLSAAAVLQLLLAGDGEQMGVSGTAVQFGGDASTGRGLVMVQAVEGA